MVLVASGVSVATNLVLQLLLLLLLEACRGVSGARLRLVQLELLLLLLLKLVLAHGVVVGLRLLAWARVAGLLGCGGGRTVGGALSVGVCRTLLLDALRRVWRVACLPLASEVTSCACKMVRTGAEGHHARLLLEDETAILVRRASKFARRWDHCASGPPARCSLLSALASLGLLLGYGMR